MVVDSDPEVRLRGAEIRSLFRLEECLETQISSLSWNNSFPDRWWLGSCVLEGKCVFLSCPLSLSEPLHQCCIIISLHIWSSLRIMWLLYISEEICAKIELRVTDWMFFICNIGCFSDRVCCFSLYIFRCESPWCFYFPLNAVLRNISFQEVSCFVGVVWNPQEVPSNVLLLMMLLPVISACVCAVVVSVHDDCKLHLFHLHVFCAFFCFYSFPPVIVHHQSASKEYSTKKCSLLSMNAFILGGTALIILEIQCNSWWSVPLISHLHFISIVNISAVLSGGSLLAFRNPQITLLITYLVFLSAVDQSMFENSIAQQQSPQSSRAGQPSARRSAASVNPHLGASSVDSPSSGGQQRLKNAINLGKAVGAKVSAEAVLERSSSYAFSTSCFFADLKFKLSSFCSSSMCPLDGGRHSQQQNHSMFSAFNQILKH